MSFLENVFLDIVLGVQGSFNDWVLVSVFIGFLPCPPYKEGGRLSPPFVMRGMVDRDVWGVVSVSII